MSRTTSDLKNQCLYFLGAFLLTQELTNTGLVKAKNTDKRCTDYTTLDERFRNTRNKPVRIPRCDDNLAAMAWYRFIGDAGTRMPSTPISAGRCGAERPGWIQGSHPSGIGVTTHALVCFDVYKTATCGAKVNTQITDCGRYYVYKLPRIRNCSRVYCGEDGGNGTFSPNTSSLTLSSTPSPTSSSTATPSPSSTPSSKPSPTATSSPSPFPTPFSTSSPTPSSTPSSKLSPTATPPPTPSPTPSHSTVYTAPRSEQPTTASTDVVLHTKTSLHLCGEENYNGILWPTTPLGDSSTQPCPGGNGFVTRMCTSSGWKDVNTNCKSYDIYALYYTILDLRESNVSHAYRTKAAKNIIKTLSNITDLEQTVEKLTQYDLAYSVKILLELIKMNISDTSLKLLKPVSNILDPRNAKSWNAMKNSAETISDFVVGLEEYGFQLGRNLKTTKHEATVIQRSSNLELHVIVFKHGSPFRLKYNEVRLPNSSFNLSPSVFSTSGGTTTVAVVVHYKTLHAILKKGKWRQGDSNDGNTNTEYQINSEIITASVEPRPPALLEKPVRIIWKKKPHLLDDSSACVFWKPEVNGSLWSSEGCRRIQHSKHGDHLICECNHLTAFASMDISEFDIVTPRERQSLELISTIGCSLSLFGIILTIASHAVLWRKLHLTSKTVIRQRVLIHLCVAVGMTDILAIVAGPVQSNETICRVVSILLYFSVLSVFGWMLCEGITIYLQLVRVFSGLGGRHIRVFCAIGWGIPIIVVGLSVGLVDRDEFITKHACWFRARGPLLWTFIGTTGMTLLVNFSILILVLKSMFSSKQLIQAGKLNRARAGIKAIAVLLPLLGLTWLFGLLVFNRETIIFKYLFAIFNSLQGLMIFFFHVVINKQMHDAIWRKRKLRISHSAKATNAFTLNQKCGTLSTSDTNFKTDPVALKTTFKRSKRTKSLTPLVLSSSSSSNSNNNSINDITLEELEHNV